MTSAYPSSAHYRLNSVNDRREYTQHGKKIGRAHLANTFNYINFSNGIVLINFRHTRFDNTISYRARPFPCLGDTLECAWAGPDTPYRQAAAYEFKDVLVPEGQKLLLVKPDGISLSRDGIRFRIPEACIEVSSRKVKRSLCEDIRVELSQNCAVFKGTLIDFCTVSFRVAVTAKPPQTFQWIDLQTPVNIMFSDRNETLYSGECRIIKQTGGLKTRNFIVEPLNSQVPRFKKKKYRNTRQELIPAPHVMFKHPFTEKISTLKVIDIAGSGFSVEEEKASAVLLPGMFMPELELHFANSFKVRCKAQVVYKSSLNGTGNGSCLKCGMALIDMSPRDHGKLLSILYQAENDNSYLCSTVSLDDLWEFFFATGFIYPEKYGFFQKNKEDIKETYKKLYTENPDMARHFIYQEKGRILGHMAMIRFYNNSWLIHHHAAGRTGFIRAGLVVLNQISRFIHDSHRLYATKMNFVFCYYRPENKFPDRVFGGAARNIDDPKGCSLDTFSYFHFRTASFLETKVAPPWHLVKTEGEDLSELKNFYEFNSGGLMLKALELDSDSGDINEVVEVYAKAGLKRKRYLFSLKKENVLKAIFILNISDVGLNLSELTNSITAIVIDPDKLPKEIFYAVLSCQIKKFKQSEIPVLLYPDSYVEEVGIPHEKLYKLWIINTKYSDRYFRYMHRILRRIDH